MQVLSITLFYDGALICTDSRPGPALCGTLTHHTTIARRREEYVCRLLHQLGGPIQAHWIRSQTKRELGIIYQHHGNNMDWVNLSYVIAIEHKCGLTNLRIV